MRKLPRIWDFIFHFYKCGIFSNFKNCMGNMGFTNFFLLSSVFFFHFFSIFASFLLHFCRTPPQTPDLGRTRELRRSSADLLCSWRVLPTPTSTSSSTATACADLWSSDLSRPFSRGSGRVRRCSPPRSEQFRSVVPPAVQI